MTKGVVPIMMTRLMPLLLKQELTITFGITRQVKGLDLEFVYSNLRSFFVWIKSVIVFNIN